MNTTEPGGSGATGSAARPMLTHVGINVIDIDKMADFYMRTLGLTMSDSGVSARLKSKFVFLTSDPAVHHQVVLSEVREEGSPGNINQLSFRVSTLDELRAFDQRLRDASIEANPVTHGNAWSVYFSDPEGNLIEVYLDSPFYFPQPQGKPFDLGQSDEELLRAAAEWAETVEGAMSHEAWSAGLAKKITAGD
jgi:catechol 2,3-dioxygenase